MIIANCKKLTIKRQGIKTKESVIGKIFVQLFNDKSISKNRVKFVVNNLFGVIFVFGIDFAREYDFKFVYNDGSNTVG
jgi:hypothetical protein